jgi:LPS export ABC transporter permease LptG
VNSLRAPWFGIVGRRLVKDVLADVLLATFAGVTLLLVVDIIELGNLAGDVATPRDMLLLAAYGLPTAARRVMLVSAPIGAITAVGGMARRSELGAIFAAGASPAMLARPIAVAAALVAGVHALIVEFAVPAASPSLSATRHRLGLADSTLEGAGRLTWFKGKERLFRVDSLTGAGGASLGGVLMMRVDGGRLTERLDIDSLSYRDGRWIGRGIVARTFGRDSDGIRTERIPERALDLPEQPEDFETGVALPAHLSYAALSRTMLARERRANPALAHRIELYQRHTTPLVLILSMAIAAALAVRLGRRQSLAATLGVGASTGFLVWYVAEFERLIAASGGAKPEIAAHAFPLIWLLVGGLLWRRVYRRGVAEG